MKYDISHAMPILAPGAQWSLIGDSYDQLTWISGDPLPSEADLMAKVAELQEAEAMRLLRKERDKRLAAVDWVVVRSISSGEPLSDEWRAYMNALRNLPDNSTPKLLEHSYDLDLDSIDWPVKPD